MGANGYTISGEAGGSRQAARDGRSGEEVVESTKIPDERPQHQYSNRNSPVGQLPRSVHPSPLPNAIGQSELGSCVCRNQLLRDLAVLSLT